MRKNFFASLIKDLCPGRSAARSSCGAVRCRAGAVTHAGVWYGPGSAKQRFAKSYALHRARDTTSPNEKRGRRPRSNPVNSQTAYLILDSLNSTCLRATGSYFFLTSLSVMVREFFLAT